MSNPDKRRYTEFMKLMKKDYKVKLINNETHNFIVHFNGPVNSLYEGGVWRVRVELPEDYPNKSPSIRFENKIFHPNIHGVTGAICLYGLNEGWTPEYELVHVFDVFIPSLLKNPDPFWDPFNPEAAALLAGDMYEAQVKEYVARYANPKDVGDIEEENPTDKEVSEDATGNLGDEASGSGPAGP